MAQACLWEIIIVGLRHAIAASGARILLAGSREK
jgi:hypothetical protein